MTPTEFADWQQALLYVAGPSLAWLLSFAVAGAILLTLIAASVGILRRVRNWN